MQPDQVVPVVGTRFPEFFARLGAPFEPAEVKTRSQAGQQFRYVTARTVQNRLDNCLGPENWWTEFTRHENSVECRLTIRLPDGTTLTKVDAGGYAGMADSGDDDKSAYSDGIKRAASVLGIGRYLYGDGVPTFVAELTGEPGPALPLTDEAEAASRREVADAGPARVGNAAPSRPASETANRQASAPSGENSQGVPRTGKALYAWVMDQEKRNQVGLLKYLNGFGKTQEFPGRMIDWNAEQVGLGYAQAVRKIRGRQPAREREESYEEAAF